MYCIVKSLIYFQNYKNYYYILFVIISSLPIIYYYLCQYLLKYLLI